MINSRGPASTHDFRLYRFHDVENAVTGRVDDVDLAVRRHHGVGCWKVRQGAEKVQGLLSLPVAETKTRAGWACTELVMRLLSANPETGGDCCAARFRSG